MDGIKQIHLQIVRAFLIAERKREKYIILALEPFEVYYSSL